SGGEATQALVGLLERDDDREKVLTALITPVEGRVPVLAAGLAIADDELAALLVMALTRMHRPDADPALLTALTHAASPGRKAAAQGVASSIATSAASALRRAAHEDPDPEVRRVAALLLSE